MGGLVWSGEFASGLCSRWTGIFRYDPVADVKLPGETTFTMRLDHAALGGFTGAVDDGDGGIPEPATVTGRIFLRSMRFAKRYPHLWLPSTENPAGPLAILPGAAPVPVRYLGRLAADGCSAEGRWAIPATTVRLDGQWMRIGSVLGTWRATRIDLRPDQQRALGPMR